MKIVALFPVPRFQVAEDIKSKIDFGKKKTLHNSFVYNNLKQELLVISPDKMSYSIEALKEAQGSLSKDDKGYKLLEEVIQEKKRQREEIKEKLKTFDLEVLQAIEYEIVTTRTGVWFEVYSEALDEVIHKKKEILSIKYKIDHIYTMRNGLPSNNIQTVIEDKEGNIWVGTRDGLAMWNRETKKFTTYTKKNGLPSDDIQTIIEDKKGNIWVGTWGDGLAVFEKTVSSALETNNLGGIDMQKINVNANPASSSVRMRIPENIEGWTFRIESIRTISMPALINMISSTTLTPEQESKELAYLKN